MFKLLRSKFRAGLDRKYKKLHLEIMNLNVSIGKMEKRRKKIAHHLAILGMIKGEHNEEGGE